MKLLAQIWTRTSSKDYCPDELVVLPNSDLDEFASWKDSRIVPLLDGVLRRLVGTELDSKTRRGTHTRTLDTRLDSSRRDEAANLATLIQSLVG